MNEVAQRGWTGDVRKVVSERRGPLAQTDKSGLSLEKALKLNLRGVDSYARTYINVPNKKAIGIWTPHHVIGINSHKVRKLTHNAPVLPIFGISENTKVHLGSHETWVIDVMLAHTEADPYDAVITVKRTTEYFAETGEVTRQGTRNPHGAIHKKFLAGILVEALKTGISPRAQTGVHLKRENVEVTSDKSKVVGPNGPTKAGRMKEGRGAIFLPPPA